MSIVIENLSKSYGPVRALQNVSCTWEPGKLYGLLGIRCRLTLSTLSI